MKKFTTILILLQIMCYLSYIRFASAETMNFHEFEQIKIDLFATSDIHLNEPNSFNSTKFRDCLIELSAIKNGLNNFDEWAIKCKCFLKNLNI